MSWDNLNSLNLKRFVSFVDKLV